MSISPLPNPFTQRGAIREPTQFFGRKTETEQILAWLKTMQCVSVVGERRIGNSSLLVHISQTGGQHLETDVRLCYTDLPGVSDEASFYGRICQELDIEGSSFSDFEKALRGKRVVICLDEFENVAGQAAFSRGFFDGLRSLAQSGRFALVVATQHPLPDLFGSEVVVDSPFWNIFSRIDLGLFTRQEAEASLRYRFTAANVSLTETEVSRVLELSGRFPLFFEIACYHLFEQKASRVENWEIAFNRDPDVDAHLRYLWDCRTGPEQAALRWILNPGGRRPEDYLLMNMERRGLLVRESREVSGYWPFSPAFADMVRKPPLPKRRKARFAIHIKEYEIGLWPPSIKIKTDGGQTQ